MALPTNITIGDPLPSNLNATNTAINRAVEGTGWRAITSQLQNGWTAVSVRIRRRGDTVELKTAGLNGTAATADTFLNTTATPDLQAFMPEVGNGIEFALRRSTSSDAHLGVFVSNTTATSPARVKASDNYQTVSWDVGKRAWPTTLPGTAV